MVKKFKENFNFITNILILLTLVFGGLTYAVGFHIPDEIISGTFNNNYSFNGSLNFTNANISGLSSTPTGAVIAFNLASCPSGWLTSDGTSGTTDLRGRFVRGLDLGAGVDPSRVLGSYQVDDFKSHSHNLGVSIQTYGNPSGGGGVFTQISNSQTGATGGTETRPKNIALIYCQKQ